MSAPSPRQVGAALQLLRSQHGIELEDAASTTQLPMEELRRWEEGKTSPSLADLWRYLEALHCDLCDLQLALVREAPADSGSSARFLEFVESADATLGTTMEGVHRQPAQPARDPVFPVLRKLLKLSQEPTSLERMERIFREEPK